MKTPANYLDINRQSWNQRTASHIQSEFYNMEAFLQGQSSLKEVEQKMLGEVKGKSILHLQCHFGQDSISLSRMGAQVTGVDLADKAIESARQLAKDLGTDTRFICCDLYDLNQHLNEQFDIVFTSYGTIGWLPDLEAWASLIKRFLKPGGQFIFVEFHPVVWMFDDDFQQLAYSYFNKEAIVENESGTYADPDAPIESQYVMWNHDLGEVMSSLLRQGLQLDTFEEFDYSPHNCFKHTVEYETGKFRIKHLDAKIPMLYALSASKTK